MTPAAPVMRAAPERGIEGCATPAFFEACFPNFVAGTAFEVSEATDIVCNNAIPGDRPEDAHDVIGTWQIVSDPAEMARIPRTPAILLDLIHSRHATLMSAHTDKRREHLKTEYNRAGQTLFVAPDQVEGTLGPSDRRHDWRYGQV